jgi:hypothetical protein
MPTDNESEERRIARLETEFVQASGLTCTTAYASALQAGFHVMVAKGDTIVEVSTDGSERLVKVIIGPTPVQPGARYTLQ